MANVEQSICDAIDIIVDKAVSEAAYDKTVRATIVSCEDESAGYYKLHYQDSTIYAYSLQTDYTYATGTSVYVLVPADDMTNTKTILGTTDKLGNDYIAVIEPEDQFSVVGKNVITCNDTFALQSYRKNGCSINLYNKNNSKNAIDVDITGVEQYFAESDVLICGGVMQTALDREQQTQGDYGIMFTLEFKDKSTGDTVERQYPVNVDIMTGQPYNYISPTRQYGIFEFDKENFVDISDITIYCKNFPNSRDNPPDDIFISEIEMEGAVAISQEDLNGYYLNLVTAKGTYFAQGSSDTETLTAEAVLRDAGKIVNIDSQELPVYWFIEHAGITSKSQYYCSFGGAGWKCLNEYLVITEATDDAEASVEWIPGDKTFTLAKTDLKAKSAQYKCVVIYNGTAVSATVTFKNLDSSYDITVESTNGTQFYYDVGTTSLITKVNSKEERGSDYSYAWAISDALGGYTTLTNDDVTSALEVEYEEKYQEIVNDSSLYEEQKEAMLEELNEEYKELLSGTYVDGNRVENIKASSIYIFNTYKCSVFLYDDFIGTTSITLLNSDESTGYSLVMNNNSYTYKYNEAGVGPTSTSLLNPITLMPLSYNLYDCDGQDITDDVFNVCDVKWYVPSTDVSLLTIPDSYDSYIIGEENNYTIYGNTKTLVYEIATRYSISKSVNDIYLTVEYEDMVLVAKSNLTFVKEGENGTNGTEYSCKIVPYVRNGGVVPNYPIVSMYKTGTDSSGSNVYNDYSFNYTYTQNQPFTLQLYHNETLVFNSPSSGSTEDHGLDITLNWSVLCNKYSLGVYDDSNLTVTNSSTGTITWNPQKTEHDPANIIKVEVNVGNETTLYATLPVISVWYDDDFDYTLKLRENTGFLYATYASDGTSPQWDNLKPFTFDYTKVVNGIECNINQEVNRILKTKLGQVYESENKIWKDDLNLEDYTSLQREEEDYEWWLKPSDSYDGWCVTNAVKYSCGTGEKLVASIHVPVHLMINRYGLASLNGWDGNSIQIDEEGGFILAPQIGAGHKESDNSFTGMVMGDVRESGNSSYNVASGLETGLFAYNSGRRTIFLDATTGKSVFGTTGTGQIVIDPGDGSEEYDVTAKIYSGDYIWYEDDPNGLGAGLLIDLEEPCIIFGNGNFTVDKNGNLTAKGHGNIAGWYIDDYTIYTALDDTKAPSYTYNDEGELDTSTVYISSAQFTKTINNEKLSNLRISVGDNFGLTATGEVYSNTLHVGAGKNKIIISEELDDEGNIVGKEPVIVDDDGNTEEVSTHSAIYYQKQGFNVNKTGFYLGTDGIALGDYSSIYGHSMFEVDADTGEFIARNGYIGTKNYGWRIEDTYMYNAKSYFEDPTKGIFIGTGKYQYPDDATDEDRAKTYGGIAIGEYNERYYSTSPFQVTIDGELTARSGYIGDYRNGWWIEDTYLYNGQKEINPEEDAVDEDGKSIYHTSGIYLGVNGIGLGNGYFYVTNDGYLYAQGGGTLAGWTIDDYSIYTGNGEVDSRISSRDTANVRLSAGTFSRYIEGFSSNEDDPIKNLRFAIGNKFAVNNQGDLYANNANIKGNFDIQGPGKISGWSIDEYSIYTGDPQSSYNSEIDPANIYLSSAQIRGSVNGITVSNLRFLIGDNFGITSDGDVYATTVYIGGELSTGAVSRQKLTLTTDGSKAAIYYNKTSCDITSTRNGFYIGTDGIAIGRYFKVDTDADTADFGGWKLTEDTLYYNGDTVGSKNVILTTREDLSGTINRSNTIDNLRFVISNKFGIDGDGHLYASEGTLGSGNYLITLGQGENNSATHACIYGRNHSSLDDETDGYYLGTDGLSIGKYFSVDEQGRLIAKHITATNDGNIAGWSINSTELTSTSTSGNITISSSGSITGGTNGGNYWSISNNGYVNFNYGNIGGWTIDSTMLSAGNISISSNGGISAVGASGSWSIKNDGSVNFNSGTIGSCKIESDQIASNTTSGASQSWYIKSNGEASFTGLTVDGVTINGATLKGSISGGTITSAIDTNSARLGLWHCDGNGYWTNDIMSLESYTIESIYNNYLGFHDGYLELSGGQERYIRIYDDKIHINALGGLTINTSDVGLWLENGYLMIPANFGIRFFDSNYYYYGLTMKNQGDEGIYITIGANVICGGNCILIDPSSAASSNNYAIFSSQISNVYVQLGGGNKNENESYILCDEINGDIEIYVKSLGNGNAISLRSYILGVVNGTY